MWKRTRRFTTNNLQPAAQHGPINTHRFIFVFLSLLVHIRGSVKQEDSFGYKWKKVVTSWDPGWGYGLRGCGEPPLGQFILLPFAHMIYIHKKKHKTKKNIKGKEENIPDSQGPEHDGIFWANERIWEPICRGSGICLYFNKV